MCYKTSQFLLFTYEYKPSVPPVEHKQKRLETDTLPESRWQPYKNISPREQRKYSQLLLFLQNKVGFSELRQSVSERFCSNNKRKQKTLLQLSLRSSHFGRDVIEACYERRNTGITRSPQFLGIRPSRKYAVVTRLSPPPAHLIISAERAWGGPPPPPMNIKSCADPLPKSAA